MPKGRKLLVSKSLAGMKSRPEKPNRQPYYRVVIWVRTCSAKEENRWLSAMRAVHARYHTRMVPVPRTMRTFTPLPPATHPTVLIAYSVSGIGWTSDDGRHHGVNWIAHHRLVVDWVESDATVGRGGTGHGDKPMRPKNNHDYTMAMKAEQLTREYLPDYESDPLPLGIARSSGPCGPTYQPPVGQVNVKHQRADGSWHDGPLPVIRSIDDGTTTLIRYFP